MATIPPQTIEFADTAPVWVEGTAIADATPEQVWQVLVDYPRWPSWFGGGVSAVRATSDPATGIGSTREVLLGKGKPLRFHERFIAWDEGERWAFTAIEAPGVLAGLVERCLIEPISPIRTRVTYRMAFAPKAVLKPLVPVLRPGIRRALGKGMQGLAAEAKARATT